MEKLHLVYTWIHSQPDAALIFRLLLASTLAGVLGIERERSGRPAGVRTHVLVAVGTCLFMVLSELMYTKYSALTGESILRVDPARLAAQVISGLGFICGGVLVKEGASVRGLTTAACLWVAAAIGMSVGSGWYFPAIAAMVVSLASLRLLRFLEPIINRERYLHLVVHCELERCESEKLMEVFFERNLRIVDIGQEVDVEKNDIKFDLVVTNHNKRIGAELTERILKLDGIRKIRYK